MIFPETRQLSRNLPFRVRQGIACLVRDRALPERGIPQFIETSRTFNNMASALHQLPVDIRSNALISLARTDIFSYISILSLLKPESIVSTFNTVASGDEKELLLSGYVDYAKDMTWLEQYKAVSVMSNMCLNTESFDYLHSYLRGYISVTRTDQILMSNEYSRDMELFSRARDYVQGKFGLGLEGALHGIMFLPNDRQPLIFSTLFNEMPEETFSAMAPAYIDSYILGTKSHSASARKTEIILELPLERAMIVMQGIRSTRKDIFPYFCTSVRELLLQPS